MAEQKVLYCVLLWLFAFANHHVGLIEGRNSPMPKNVDDIESERGLEW